MIDFQPLLKLSYWFDRRPPAIEQNFQTFFFYFFGAMLVLALVINVLVRKKKKEDPWVAQGFQKISSWCLSMGISGLALIFFSFERLPVLSMRFLFILWIIGAIVWAVFIIKFFVKKIPAEKRKIKEHQTLKKYIPGNK